MSEQAKNQTPAEAAMVEVLGAERDALEKIADCKAQAEQILRQARRDVRELVRHTQNRISRLHSGCASRTSELVGEMEDAAAARATRSLPEDIERERLLATVGRVAAQLTARDDADAD